MYNSAQTLRVDRDAIWHPYTAMQDYAHRDPLVIVKGRGIKLFAADGKMYYDTVSSWWCNVHGHAHPALNRGIRRQLRRLSHVLFAGITHPGAAEVADRLGGWLAPELTRFFFSDNGSTSVEIALKMAFQYWQNQGITQKTKFVFLKNSYHGDTAGSMSVGGIDLYHRLYAPLRFASFQADSPACSACPHRTALFTGDGRQPGCALECFASMEKILRAHREEIAAVIVEPLMQGSAGISFYPPEYLRRLRALADEQKILVIFDEVATGFGRLGTFFAYQQAGVVPDFLCLSKGLTAGYLPMALTVTREFVYRAFYADPLAQKTFFHGHTYTANPLACAAAIENLALLKRNRLPESRAGVWEHFHRRLREWAEFDWVGDIRHLGWVGAVDLVQSRDRRLPFPSARRIGFHVFLESLKNNLFLRPLDNTIYWFLPLCVTKKEIDRILDKSRKTLRAVMGA